MISRKEQLAMSPVETQGTHVMAKNILKSPEAYAVILHDCYSKDVSPLHVACDVAKSVPRLPIEYLAAVYDQLVWLRK